MHKLIPAKSAPTKYNIIIGQNIALFDYIVKLKLGL